MPTADASRKIPITIHPRVFASLGSDLVTSDFVAITELVKNAYDAFADRVDVRFLTDKKRGAYLEISDNGHGMSEETVEDVWCVVATPYRVKVSVVEKNGRTRRVSGEKGLGRLSVARLGDRLEMTTRWDGSAGLKVTVAWQDLSVARDLNDCTAEIQTLAASKSPPVGTSLRIYDLKSEWSVQRIAELQEHLSRLLSPFTREDGFQIWIQHGEQGAEAKIEPPAFLGRPKYRFTGQFTLAGVLKTEYVYAPFSGENPARSVSRDTKWDEIQSFTRVPTVKDTEKPNCGPLEFEIRAWDIAPDDVSEIAEQFAMQKSLVRDSIRAHKGLSVYRDGILVLPKSDASKDWLGLDLRRVSSLGSRLSTSQIVGYVGITAEKNPRIRDTSDRERLVDCPEVTVFEEVIRMAISILEGERASDRLEKVRAEPPLHSLFGQLSTETLTAQVNEVVKRKGPAQEVVPIVKEFEEGISKTREEIERRFVYYSRLATIGTLAESLVHEVRNKTTIVGAYLEQLAKTAQFVSLPEKYRDRHERAVGAIVALDRLAEAFLPLANRSYGRGRRMSVLEDRIAGNLTLLESQLKQAGIEVRSKAAGSTPVSIDPGELDAVLLNLLYNAIYWVSQSPKGKRIIEVQVKRLRGGDRVKVGVHDSGPGVKTDDLEMVFWPGVSKKPGGIGMGLTIASEIVDAHDGKMAVASPGNLGGASFEFDLPIKQN